MKKIVTYILLLVAPYFSFSQDYWEIIDVPDTINITCMAANNQNHIFLGTVGTIGGIYQSVDNCYSWEFIGFENTGIEFIELNTSNHLFTSFSHCIYKSINNGIHWDTIYHNNEIISIKCLKSYNVDLIFTGLSFNIAGIIRSINGGEDWEEVFILPSNAEFFYDFAILNEDTVFACTTNWFDGGGVYLSEDGGDNWEHIGMYDFHCRSLVKNSMGDIFVGTYGHNTQYWLSGVYVLYYGESEWVQLYTTLVNDMIINADDDIYVATDYGVLESTDNGQTFEFINEGLFEGNVDDLALDSTGFLYASSYDPCNMARSLDPTITNIDQNKIKKEKFRIQTFPNPFCSFITFNINSDFINQPIEIVIYSLLGQPFKIIKTKTSQNGNIFLNIEAGYIPAGTYIYSVNCHGKVYSDILRKE